MAVNYNALLRNLEHELLHESPAFSELEGEASHSVSSVVAGPLRSLRFVDDPDLQAVALGRLRLGRPTDSPYPAPIGSQGSSVQKVQQALLDLGYPLPRNGDDGRYGQETYQAVLAYKRQFNIRTLSGYLDGIVGTKTIKHLDSNFAPGPLPACGVPGGLVVASAEGEFEDTSQSFGVPWVTCDPLLPTDDGGGFCSKSLPDKIKLDATGGGGVIAPSIGGFYCIKKPHVHLEFTASWIEMVQTDQRSPEERDRVANTPTYQVNFKGYTSEWLNPDPKVVQVRDITVTAPGIGRVQFLMAMQRNRIFHVDLSISES